MRPADVGRNDQRHAELRQLVRHMSGHVGNMLGVGQPSDVALGMGRALARSNYTREALAYMLGVALVELETR